MGKAILAVIVGYVVMTVVIILCFTGLRFGLGTERVFDPGTYNTPMLFNVLVLGVSLGAALIGGIVASGETWNSQSYSSQCPVASRTPSSRDSPRNSEHARKRSGCGDKREVIQTETDRGCSVDVLDDHLVDESAIDHAAQEAACCAVVRNSIDEPQKCCPVVELHPQLPCGSSAAGKIKEDPNCGLAGTEKTSISSSFPTLLPCKYGHPDDACACSIAPALIEKPAARNPSPALTRSPSRVAEFRDFTSATRPHRFH